MNVARKSPRVGDLGFVTPQLLLVVASLIVALSILLGAPFARPLNGVGGILWIASAVWMVASLREEPRRVSVGLVAFASAMVMALVVRPGSYLEALAGFAIAGAAVAVAAGPSAARWALLAPAVYFPLHIVIALGRVIASGGARAVRTDPPPTDAFVPFSMVVAAGVAGYVVGKIIDRRGASPR